MANEFDDTKGLDELKARLSEDALAKLASLVHRAAQLEREMVQLTTGEAARLAKTPEEFNSIAAKLGVLYVQLSMEEAMKALPSSETTPAIEHWPDEVAG
jgi:hypothetical protein